MLWLTTLVLAGLAGACKDPAWSDRMYKHIINALSASMQLPIWGIFLVA